MSQEKLEPSPMAKQIATDLDHISNKLYCLHSMGSEERDKSVVNIVETAIRTGAYNMLFPQYIAAQKEEKPNA